VLADAIGLRRENVPQNKFLLRIGWGEGGRTPDEVNRETHESRENLQPLMNAD